MHGFDRVNKMRKCPICGKPDWCLVAKDRSAAICTREVSGKPMEKAMGWLHRLTETRVVKGAVVTRRLPKPTVDWDRLQERFCDISDKEVLASIESENPNWTLLNMYNIGTGYSPEHDAKTFPMLDGDGKIVGIRLRATDGRKWAMPGSSNGLFYPYKYDVAPDPTVYVVEGPTDCIALLDISLYPVGMPACQGGGEYLCDWLQNTKRHVVLIVENDKPDAKGRRAGLEGFTALAHKIHPYARSVKMIHPPAAVKDTRDWIQGGGTKAEIEFIASQTGEFQPNG